MSYVLSGYHFKCEWCGKALGFKETENAYTVITNPCDNSTEVKYLCSECKQFPSKESMELWKSYKLNYSLLNIPITLDSVKSECINGEWTVTCNFIIKYKGEGQLIRKGWIA